SLKSPASTFCAFSDAEEDEEDDEEEDLDQDNISTDKYDDVSGEASDEADVFARHGGFKWQRVDKLCNEVREFGADLIDVDELTSVYDFRNNMFQRQAILAFLRGFSVVVSAPTSSRKTLIAEAATECEYLLTTAFHAVLVMFLLEVDL
ncbi:DEAD-box ATP-dependent RNA helicase ISE2, chloroplastic, partial [Glycine soja]